MKHEIVRSSRKSRSGVPIRNKHFPNNCMFCGKEIISPGSSIRWGYFCPVCLNGLCYAHVIKKTYFFKRPEVTCPRCLTRISDYGY